MIIEKLEPYMNSKSSIDGYYWEWRPNLEDVIKKVNEIIDAVNAVDAEPVRHGKWEYHTRYQRSCVASCSICKKRTTFFFKNGTKYCPFCGAKMDEE